MMNDNCKRGNNENDDSDSEWIGPTPSEAAPIKKQKGQKIN